MIKTTLKGFALCSVVALFATGQALAHTGVRDKPIDEGSTSYNGFTITHGCGEHSDAQAYPVQGQAALFPFGKDVVFRKVVPGALNGAPILDSSTKPKTPSSTGNGILDDEIVWTPTGYASFSSPFTTSQELVDSLGNVRGLFWKNGALEPKLNAITPFKIVAPLIADNCVKTLTYRVAVINYCDVDKNEDNDDNGPWKAPKDAFGRPIPFVSDINNGGLQTNVNASPVFKDIRAGNGDNNRADWWFYDIYGGSALYADQELTEEGQGLWSAGIVVSNSRADLAKCKGKQYDATVEPTGAAFDEILTGPNTRPFTKGNKNL